MLPLCAATDSCRHMLLSLLLLLERAAGANTCLLLTEVMNLKDIMTFALLRVTMRMYKSAWRRYMKVQLPSVRTGVCRLADSPLLLRICVLKFSAMSRLRVKVTGA
jgi:hypothetical protein